MKVSVSTTLKELKNATSNVHIYASLLRQCRAERSLGDGKLVHDHIVQQQHGRALNAYLGNLLVQMYGKCGDVQKARAVFDVIPKESRTVISWSLLIAAYAQEGYSSMAISLYHEMTVQGLLPNEFTLSLVLSACGDLRNLHEGRCIHLWATNNGLESNFLVNNALVSMYTKCGSFNDAKNIFDGMGSGKTVVTWNSLISGYVRHGYFKEALDVYEVMTSQAFEPSNITLTAACGACAGLGDLKKGRKVHSTILLNGFQTHTAMQNALVNMYAKCGSLADAKTVFDAIPRKDVVSWTSMIAAYAQNGFGLEGVQVYHDMESRGVQPNELTFTSVLNALSCSGGGLEEGRRIHRLADEYRSHDEEEPNVILENAILNMYAKCGSFEEAKLVFDRMQLKADVVSWTNMIGACVHHGRALEAVNFFHFMSLEGIPWNTITLASILDACSMSGARSYGRKLHQQLQVAGFASISLVQNGLIDMYAKFGFLEESWRIFSGMKEKTVVAWTTMITAYAQHGRGNKAMELFKEMNLEGKTLDSTTFICILAACNHAGLVEQGKEIFRAMVADYCITPVVAHYSKAVDFIARAGRLQDAEELIKTMPFQPDLMAWKTLLNACRIHNQVDAGARAAERVADLDIEGGSAYVMLSNIVAASKRSGNVADEEGEGLHCRSFIEVGNKVHEFVSGGHKVHPRNEDIRAEMNVLNTLIAEAGYIARTGGGDHSLRYATAFGLLGTSAGTTLTIFTNFRVCSDCHSATKVTSSIYHRKIILRDTTRFHHFENGLCSCRDLW